MKKTLYTALMGVFALLAFTACSKSDDDTSKYENLPNEVKSIVSFDVLKKLEASGMVINLGTTPPNIEGSYSIAPFELEFTDVPDPVYVPGHVITGYQYRFYDQKGVNVKTDYENKDFFVQEKALGKGTIISGSGNKFTVFMEVDGEHVGEATYKNLALLSGEVTPQGIKNFKYGFYMMQKDDPYNKLMPVGATRIWFDNDFISERL